MAKARVLIELDIEYDELQYEDGFIGTSNVQEAFDSEFNLVDEKATDYDLRYKINRKAILVTNLPESN